MASYDLIMRLLILRTSTANIVPFTGRDALSKMFTIDTETYSKY